MTWMPPLLPVISPVNFGFPRILFSSRGRSPTRFVSASNKLRLSAFDFSSASIYLRKHLNGNAVFWSIVFSMPHNGAKS